MARECSSAEGPAGGSARALACTPTPLGAAPATEQLACYSTRSRSHPAVALPGSAFPSQQLQQQQQEQRQQWQRGVAVAALSADQVDTLLQAIVRPSSDQQAALQALFSGFDGEVRRF